jgi:hypothetical protein
MRIIVVATVAVFLAGCSVFGIRTGTEQRVYEVIETLPSGLEIRRYAPAVFARASVPSDADSPRSTAFRMLFRYITGANEGERDIAMTAPVSISEDGSEIAMTAPVRTESEDDFMAMRFYLPASFTMETAPIPTEAGVSLGEEPGRTVAVLRYTWSTGAEKAARMRGALMDALPEGGWRATGDPYSMFYDPPWTLPFLRRNEAVVDVVKAD